MDTEKSGLKKALLGLSALKWCPGPDGNGERSRQCPVAVDKEGIILGKQKLNSSLPYFFKYFFFISFRISVYVLKN